MKKIAIFGDSILRGVMVDKKTKRFVFGKGIDWSGIEEKTDAKITNYSKMGSTIMHGYTKLENYLNDSPDADVIVLEFGGNDSDYNWAKIATEKSKHHTSNTDLGDFERMLNSMLDMVIAKNIKPILVTLQPIHSTRYYKWITRNGANKENIKYFLRDKEVIYRRQEMFNSKVVEIAAKRRIKLIDIRSKLLANDNYLDLLCEDGIHLNENGGKLITQCFIQKLSSI